MYNRFFTDSIIAHASGALLNRFLEPFPFKASFNTAGFKCENSDQCTAMVRPDPGPRVFS